MTYGEIDTNDRVSGLAVFLYFKIFPNVQTKIMNAAINITYCFNILEVYDV